MSRSTSSPMVRVVVVDDHPFFRDGVSRGLAQSGQITVVGEAGGGREGIDVIREERPDVALVDYQMPDLNGLDVVHAVVRDQLPTRVLLLSAVTDGAIVFRALEEGASGYLSKDASRSDIVDAVCGWPRDTTSCQPHWRPGWPTRSGCADNPTRPR